ncbi:MAG: efflux RND transporter periplasmic adaptor subunit [Bacteroidota bacterium]|nr:efflux RND transporter periplasmic adaptor subunit [Bacteroidota bacterium]
MKTIHLKLAGMLMLIVLFSCSGDKQAKLAKLKLERDKLTEQINKLEGELAAKGGTAEDAGKSPKVTVAELKAETFNHFIEIQGKLDGEDNVGVSARNAGVVDAVYVKVGDKVGKGQILAKIDDKVYQQNLNELKTRLSFAQEMYDKQKRLWDQKIGSEVQYLTAKNNKEAIENSIKTLKEQIETTRIIAPISGTVEDAPVKVGQAVSPGLPIFRVVNFSSIKVVADVAEAYATKVTVGDDALIYFPDIQKDVPAKISSVSKYINPINRSFQVEVRLKSALPNLKANMVAVLKINDYKAANAIAIPLNYVLTDQSGSFVFVAYHNSPKLVAKRVLVKQGKTYNGIVEIVEGLKAGDKVITAGQQSLEDGQTIRL